MGKSSFKGKIGAEEDAGTRGEAAGILATR